MAKPSVVPELVAKLEPWLESKHAEFVADGGSSPTLPNVGGKLNLSKMLAEAGFTTSARQHFHNWPELRMLVNAAADAQGLKGIGSRAELDAADEVAQARLNQAQRDRNDFASSLAEALMQNQALRRENDSLRAQLELRSSTGLTIRRVSDGQASSRSLVSDDD